MNNETIGISAEVAIAESFDISISSAYSDRSEKAIVKLIKKDVTDIFQKYDIPTPIKHVAEKQNPIDFILVDKSSLSVKTNKNKLGKVAPQNIGQPTSTTYFNYFSKYIKFTTPETHKEKIDLFKEISQNEIKTVMKHYWKNLFECDHLIYFYDIVDESNKARKKCQYLYLKKPAHAPKWKKDKFKFSKSLKEWNESCTVKYKLKSGKYITLGEFQAQTNRDCLKFRFDMKGLLELIENESI